MPQPAPYNRLYNFTDFQTVNPATPLPATQVDNELNAVQLTTAQIRANLAQIQRDDGALANQAVTPDSLSAGALAMIHQGEYKPRGGWANAIAYALGDVVTYNAATYLCIIAHTSVTQFANDLADNKWLLIANGALQGGGQAVDLFVGTGSQTTFTLSFNYAGNNAAVVFVGGVAQIPGSDFTINGTTITFVAAPPAPAIPGRSNVMVRGTGVEAQLAANSATTAASNASASATAAAGSATAASASAGSAAASQSAATTSATNAANSATTASTQAGIATTQATSATNSATAAAGSATTATTQATNAANSATAAAGSATTATTQATTATNQATAASNSATAAANSATSAANSASTASGAATTATTQAANALTSATGAGASATNAANSASQASTSAGNASASASSASSSASSASTSATNAANSATTAANQASAAGTSAANAATSATSAATQATNAASSATAASVSQADAAASAAAAAASLDSFDDRYLGAKASPPSVDNDGNALLVGALYFLTVSPVGLKVWDGSAWISAPQGPVGPQGIQGIQGIQGPVGPSGDLSSRVAKTGDSMSGNLTMTSGANIVSSRPGDDARNTGFKMSDGQDLGEMNRSSQFFDDRVSNCNGYLPNGNCAGNSTWNPPNGNWWTWGVSGVPTSNCANSGAFDGGGGNTSTLNPVSVSFNYDSYYVAADEIGGVENRRNFRNCNCGAFNCRTNCNCNCDCACTCK